jgi:hypothetical protein
LIDFAIATNWRKYGKGREHKQNFVFLMISKLLK